MRQRERRREIRFEMVDLGGLGGLPLGHSDGLGRTGVG